MTRKRSRHRTGYILAWRAFDVEGKTRLYSLCGGQYRWSPKTPFRAECNCWPRSHRPDIAPNPDGWCGIYALKSREDAQEYVEGGIIMAQVALWGRVIVHEYGYRAEFAYPQALYVPTHRRNGRDRIAKHYRTLAQAYAIEVYPLSIFDQKRTTPKGVRQPRPTSNYSANFQKFPICP